MIEGINLITTNLNIDLSTLVLFVSILGGLIFFISDSRIGLLCLFIIGALNILFSYKLELSMVRPTIVTLIIVVLLSLSLFNSGRMSTDSSFI